MEHPFAMYDLSLPHPLPLPLPFFCRLVDIYCCSNELLFYYSKLEKKEVSVDVDDFDEN